MDSPFQTAAYADTFVTIKPKGFLYPGEMTSTNHSGRWTVTGSAENCSPLKSRFLVAFAGKLHPKTDSAPPHHGGEVCQMTWPKLLVAVSKACAAGLCPLTFQLVFEFPPREITK